MRLNQWSLSILIASVVLAAGAVWRAGAQNGAPAPTGHIATVDLTRIFDDLDERASRESELKNFIEQQNQKITALGDQLEQAKADIELLVKGTAERRRKAEDVARLGLDAEVQRRWAEQLIDRRRAEVFADIFAEIKDATARVSAQQGFDLVLSSDADGEIPTDTEAHVRGAMGAQRVLFSSDAIDITHAVVLFMNNQWNAGQANKQ